MINWINSLNKNMVSFILPTIGKDYRVDYLKHVVQSLASLDLGAVEKELVLVNDGSINLDMEVRADVFDEYDIDLRYIYIKEQTGTVSIPRNIGISWANGQMLAHIDDDCFPEDNKALLIKEMALNPDINFIYGDRFEYVRTEHGDHNFIKIATFADHNPKHVGLDNGQFVYRANIYEKVRPEFAVNACDWELYSRIADHYKFYYMNHVVCDYIWHANNTSRTPKARRINPLTILPKYISYFKENDFTDACKNFIYI